VKATGLEKGKKYKLLFGEAEAGELSLGKTDDSSTISQSFVVPDLATSGEQGELGTMVRVRLVEAVSIAVSEMEDSFTLYSSVVLDRDVAPVGYKVNIEGRGLLSDEVYFVTTVQGENPDVAVALLKTDSRGAGHGEFIVPTSIKPGKYQIQIKNRRLNFLALRDPPILEIRDYSNTSLIPGEPSGPFSKPYCSALVTIPFTSELAVQLSATLYVIIHRLGKAVRFSSSAISLAPLGSGEAIICFAELAPGTYKVTAFAATMTGAILSRTFSFSLVIGK